MGMEKCLFLRHLELISLFITIIGHMGMHLCPGILHTCCAFLQAVACIVASFSLPLERRPPPCKAPWGSQPSVKQNALYTMGTETIPSQRTCGSCGYSWNCVTSQHGASKGTLKRKGTGPSHTSKGRSDSQRQQARWLWQRRTWWRHKVLSGGTL